MSDPRDMFRYVWSEITDDLKEQLAEMEMDGVQDPVQRLLIILPI